MKRLAFITALLVGLTPAFAFAATNDQVMCPAIYQPVCAAQQVQCVAAPCYPVYRTYGNACEASRDTTTIIHEGECTAAETGPVKPVTTYTPPAGCTSWYDGCNSCGREADGNAVCTQRACYGPTPPGYCTQYETTNLGTTTSSSTATTSTDVHIGFLTRFWHALLSFFR